MEIKHHGILGQKWGVIRNLQAKRRRELRLKRQERAEKKLRKEKARQTKLREKIENINTKNKIRNAKSETRRLEEELKGMRQDKVRKILRKKTNRSVDDAEREIMFINEYKHRDKMTTKQIQARTNRLRAEKDFEEVVTRSLREREQKEAERHAKEIASKKARQKMMINIGATVLSQVPFENLVAPKEGDPRYKKKMATMNNIKVLRTTSGTLLKAISSVQKN